MEIILDGSGKGYTAKVDDEGRLHVDSISTQREEAQSQRGYSYNLNTGNITLTNSATKNAVMYVKNNENFDIIISRYITYFGVVVVSYNFMLPRNNQISCTVL